MLYIGSDHAGFRLKKQIKKYLDELKIKYQDLGPQKLDPNDDYPDFAIKVAEQVAKKPNKNKGILICGTGQGMMLAANKVDGIRAVLAWNESTAGHARSHENANILTLGGQVLPLKTAKKVIAEWLPTPFSGAKRHIRRLLKIKKAGK